MWSSLTTTPVRGSHGTECAEIVHDMAPEADLLLMKISTSVQLAEAVNDAITYGADMISHSVGWFNTNFYDGTGPSLKSQRKRCRPASYG